MNEPYFLMCSGCHSPVPSAAAHVFPNWNFERKDFFTAYRCRSCIEKTLDDNWWSVQAIDEEMRTRFCEFLLRHGQVSDAQHLADRDLDESKNLIITYMEALAAGELVLSP